jgi:hypothetical protein
MAYEILIFVKPVIFNFNEVLNPNMAFKPTRIPGYLLTDMYKQVTHAYTSTKARDRWLNALCKRKVTAVKMTTTTNGISAYITKDNVKG